MFFNVIFLPSSWLFSLFLLKGAKFENCRRCQGLDQGCTEEEDTFDRLTRGEGRESLFKCFSLHYTKRLGEGERGAGVAK